MSTPNQITKQQSFQNREEQERKTSTNHYCSANLISPNSDLVSKIRPVRMKRNEFRTCCKNFSPIQRWMNPQHRFYCDGSVKNLNRIFPLPLSVLGLSVCSDSIVLPLYLYCSPLSTRLSETWASQVLGFFST